MINPYLLSVMKGEKDGFWPRFIVYLLLPWSLIYGLCVLCHRNLSFFKRLYRPPKTVISIGNLTVGGSGKTPLVIWLARHLQEKGMNPVILTRGYMPQRLNESDEVKMMYEEIPFIPILANADRVFSIKEMTGYMPVDVFICDDAFQHWALRRHLDIVTIDSSNPFGNGFLLPAGILREMPSALRRAGVIVLTKADQASDLKGLCQKINKINPTALIVESRYKTRGLVDLFQRTVPEDFLKNKHVIGFCAIANPSSFESLLKSMGAYVVKFFVYRDHHVYNIKEIKRMLNFCRASGVNTLVTTHKDVVKLRHNKNLFKDFHLMYIPIQLEITKGSDAFLQKVTAVVTP